MCINRFFFDHSLECNDIGHLALRLNFRQIKNLKDEEAE